MLHASLFLLQGILASKTAPHERTVLSQRRFLDRVLT